MEQAVAGSTRLSVEEVTRLISAGIEDLRTEVRGNLEVLGERLDRYMVACRERGGRLAGAQQDLTTLFARVAALENGESIEDAPVAVPVRRQSGLVAENIALRVDNDHLRKQVRALTNTLAAIGVTVRDTIERHS